VSGLFPNALHVARREYLFRVRGRAFKITTVLLAVAVIGFTLVPSFLSLLGIDDPPEVAVYVEAEGLSADPVVAIQTVLVAGAGMPGGGEDEPGDPEDRARVTRTDDPGAAAEQVREGELDGLLKITRPEADGDLAFEYVGSSSPTNTTSLLITQAASAIAISDRLERAGISAGRELPLPTIPAHGVSLLAVRPAAGKPAWMGDTLHFSQGQVVHEWNVRDRTLHARLGMGRPRRGTAWLWLPGAPLETVLDKEPVDARDLGDGVYAIDVRSQSESELIIRW